MTHTFSFKKPIVSAYFTLGRNDLGVCKQLSISLQMHRPRKVLKSNVVQLVRPFNRKVPHRDGPLNQ